MSVRIVEAIHIWLDLLWDSRLDFWQAHGLTVNKGADMSRYDQPTQEPDLDRYEPKPVEDIDVPDFDAPDELAGLTPAGRQLAHDLDRIIDILDPPKCTCWFGTDSTFGDSDQRMKCAVHGESAQVIDPAEHAAHTLVDALGTLDQEIAKVLDLPREQQLARANQLQKIMRRAWADVTRVADNAGDKVDQIVERLR